jgi:hypothetical protein
MNNVAPSPNLLRMTLAMMFGAIGDHLAGIAAPQPPKSYSEHLIALFMSVTEFYHESRVPMPCEVRILLSDMCQCAHQEHAAHALELSRAICAIGDRPGLVADSNVRIALAQANDALFAAHS